MDPSFFETDNADYFSRVKNCSSESRLRFSKIQDIKDYFFEEPEFG